VDCTVGGGGHAELVLDAVPGSQLVGIDRDDEAIAAARERLDRFGRRVKLVRAAFSDVATCVERIGWGAADGILLDVGISSHQIDSPERGFAHRLDGPLDMRMDRRIKVTAAHLLNTASEAELARIFWEYGEERKARKVARAVVQRRDEQPWCRTAEFAELVGKLVAPPWQRNRLPAATRCFQALRIAVNDELGQLRKALSAALDLLRPGGRLVVVSFHSLEDRIVKHFLREQAKTCICPPGFPLCRCKKDVTLKILTKRPVCPTEEEIEANSRATPAKLRAAERLGPRKTG